MTSWLIRTEEIWAPIDDDIPTFWKVISLTPDEVGLQNVDALGEFLIVTIDEFEKNWVPVNEQVN